MNTLQKKRIIITGASEGIGKMLCQELGRLGGEIWAVARNKEKLNILKKELPWDINIYPLDVRKKKDVQHFFSKEFTVDRQPEILINAAGVAHFAYTEDTTFEDWNRMIDTNLTGPFLMSQEIIPFLKKKKSGTIININSVAGLQPFKNASAYCASKFGLHGLTQVMREELRKYSIRVIGIHPGAVASSWWEKIEGSKNLPFSKMLKPEDVVHAIVSALTSENHAVQEEILLRNVGGNF
jgi:short-subunit dehydrogenase